MNIFLSLSYLDPVNTSDNATLVQCPFEIPLSSWDSSSFNAVAKISSLLSITVNFMTMPFTVFFNALIIFVVWKNPSLQVERVIVLAYLALADFLVGMISKPLFIAKEVLQLKTNNTNCNLNAAHFFSGLLLATAATHQLVLVTYERYVGIIHPFQYPTRITVKKLTYLSILFWALNIPVALLYSVLMANAVPLWYIEICGVVMLAAISILIVYCYVRIFAAIRRQTNCQIGQQQQNFNLNNPNILQNHKGAITAALLLGCFLISFIPLACTFLLQEVLKFRFSSSLFLSLRPWVFTFVQLGSFINPIIYGLRVRELRERCLKLLGFNSNVP